jgi:hypothetical protein
MVDPTAEQFAAAKARGNARLRGPRAESVQYDAARDRLVVRLTSGIEIGFAPRDMQGLQNASAADLTAAEVEAFGLGIHFPTLDADIYLPALLEGVFGSRRWMASRLGAAGGSTATPAKSAAARANGKRGGRPRKAAG